MPIEAIIFVVSVLLIAFAYVGYPLFIWAVARLIGEPLHPVHSAPRAVSIVLAVYNEAKTIHHRLRELLHMIDRLDPASEIIVVSDGSADGTDRLARGIADYRVHVIQQLANMGKAVALNTGVAAASNPIVIFCDARQHWAQDAMAEMLEDFRDPDVGAVSGDLVLRKDDGSLAGVGLYWRLEKWIRTNESLIHSAVQVSGSICSVRRELYVPLPPGIILDDMCWPLSVVMQGFRVIHNPAAQAFDRLPDRARDEMRRKVRTLAGNLQLAFRRPAILLPWKNPVWFNVICHKLLRLVVPWAMIAALCACAVSRQPWLRAMLILQLVGYAAGIAGIFSSAIGRNRLVNAASSLLVLNAAALMSWFVFLTGRSGRSWKKVTYTPQAGTLPAGS